MSREGALVESWVVRADDGRVVGVFATEEAARGNEGRGWLVVDSQQPDGPRHRTDDLPLGWQVERLVAGPLSVSQRFAVAALISNCDGGCAHCVAGQVRLATRLWPDVDWTAELQAHTRDWPPDPDDWPDLATEFGRTDDA